MEGARRKLIFYPITLVMVLLFNFSLIHLMPGDPLVHLLGEEGVARLSERDAAAMRIELGLEASVTRQVGLYLKRITTGDWGWSHRYGQPVIAVIGGHLQWTLALLLPALAVGTLVGGGLGAEAGWRQRDRGQQALSGLMLLLYAVPVYCIGLLVLMGAAHLNMLASMSGFGAGQGAWPAVKRGLFPFAVVAMHGIAYKFMIMRHLVRHEIQASYVLTALSKGLTDRQVLYGHILPNALPAFLVVVALNLGFMVGGTLLVEVVFSWQGMGTLIHQAVIARDYPMLSGTLTALAVSVLAANGLAELIGGRIDPRVAEGVPVG